MVSRRRKARFSPIDFIFRFSALSNRRSTISLSSIPLPQKYLFTDLYSISFFNFIPRKKHWLVR